MTDKFTRIVFRNYKAFKHFSVSLSDFNILVGPNNAGKSTIIGAFRILMEGIRKARSRKPEYVGLEGISSHAYKLTLDDLPIATENIFTNYDEKSRSSIEFTLSSGNKLELIFPERGICCMICRTTSKGVYQPAHFKSSYKVSVGIVPTLGPVEHNEKVIKRESARLSLLSHRASRNFRNIWHHYPENFERFRETIRSTWPGMDIGMPELSQTEKGAILHMFCPEALAPRAVSYPREIYWAGFGFQVWCQMLTYILSADSDSLLIIDEPDIYLHSNLQRQLVRILRESHPDILIATHSTEIISEAEASEILIVNKSERSAKRLKNPSGLQHIFSDLGSSLNPMLTQLAKCRKVVFIEGQDDRILRDFCSKLGLPSLANRSEYIVIPLSGFNPDRAKNIAKGIEMALGVPIERAIILDRDYRSNSEIEEITEKLKDHFDFVHIHDRKEIENYILFPAAIERAIDLKLKEIKRRTGRTKKNDLDIYTTLNTLSKSFKSKVSAQFIQNGEKYEKLKSPKLDPTTIKERLIEEFDVIWDSLETRINVVPGKNMLSKINTFIQDELSISLSPSAIIRSMKRDEVPPNISSLLKELERFSSK